MKKLLAIIIITSCLTGCSNQKNEVRSTEGTTMEAMDKPLLSEKTISTRKEVRKKDCKNCKKDDGICLDGEYLVKVIEVREENDGELLSKEKEVWDFIKCVK